VFFLSRCQKYLVAISLHSQSQSNDNKALNATFAASMKIDSGPSLDMGIMTLTIIHNPVSIINHTMKSIASNHEILFICLAPSIKLSLKISIQRILTGLGMLLRYLFRSLGRLLVQFWSKLVVRLNCRLQIVYHL